MSDKAPDGLPIYELDDPEAPYGLSAFGGGYVIIRPPDATPELARKIAAFTNPTDSIAWVDTDETPIYPQWQVPGPGAFKIGGDNA